MSDGSSFQRANGAGIGLRRPLYDSIQESSRVIRWLEFAPENFLDQGGWRRAALDRCMERFPLVSHGVALSVGGPEPLDGDYLARLKELLRRTRAAYFSDHLCYASAHGISFHDLLPLPFSEAAVRWAASRAREAAERVECTLLLENISYYAEMPGGTLTEGEFMTAVLEESGAGLLLDLNNVYVNARNHGRAPRDVLFELPLERTRQIHLAGHIVEGDLLLDNHGQPVCQAVWDLYREVVHRFGPIPTLIEWDTDIPCLDRVLDEADAAQRILDEASARCLAKGVWRSGSEREAEGRCLLE